MSTLGRDGIIQTIEVDEKVFEDSTEKIEEQIRKGGSTRLKFSWLEKVFEFRGKTFVLGFHSDQFVVYNLSDHNVACEMSCGGSHRSWTFRINDDSFVFTFVKEKAIEQFRYLFASNEIRIRLSYNTNYFNLKDQKLILNLGNIFTIVTRTLLDI